LKTQRRRKSTNRMRKELKKMKSKRLNRETKKSCQERKLKSLLETSKPKGKTQAKTETLIYKVFLSVTFS